MNGPARLPDLATALAETLRAILGPDGVRTDEDACDLASHDIWSKGAARAIAVVRPTTIDDLQRVICAVAAARARLVIRGGGMSYTGGYTPATDGCVSLDMSGLNRVLDIDPVNMTTTVEAGCTWKTLHDALKPLGLRTPFWGPLSGLRSTIGGGLAQQNAMYGASRYGTTSESVVALTVVTGDGRILQTSTGAPGRAPHFRFHGPDLAGLFSGDAGALGVKAVITLRLMRAPSCEGHLSYAFKTPADLFAAMAELSRAGVAAHMFAIDPSLVRIRLKRASLAADVRTLGAVIGGEKSVVKGLASAARIAMAGRNFLEPDDFALHFTCEGRSPEAVDADMREARKICAHSNGRETENTIPKVMSADPFPALNSMLGPNGERWAPVHGVVALADATDAFNAIEALFGELQASFERHGVYTAYLLTSLSTTALIVEPVFYWPDERFAVHDASVEASHLSQLKTYPANPDAARVVSDARARVVALFSTFAAGHLQIGRTYPYADRLDPAARDLIAAIRGQLDPHGVLNPGALGLPFDPQ